MTNTNSIIALENGNNSQKKSTTYYAKHVKPFKDKKRKSLSVMSNYNDTSERRSKINSLPKFSLRSELKSSSSTYAS